MAELMVQRTIPLSAGFPLVLIDLNLKARIVPRLIIRRISPKSAKNVKKYTDKIIKNINLK